MNARFFSSTTLLAALTMMPIAFADSPVDITLPDSHSVEAKGKINLYRVQMEGLEFGADKNKADAEVLVTLDSAPAEVYVLRLHGDSPPVNRVMADTLRDAFLSKAKVTLYYQKIPNRKNLNIHVVQLNN